LKNNKLSFIQGVYAAKSDYEIPTYGNSQLNGKGFSYNRLPYERYDDSQNDANYKNKAYDSTRYSARPKGSEKKGASDVKALFTEENKALGGNPNNNLIKSDPRFNLKKMNIPDYICTTICAGLNIDHIINNPPESYQTFKQIFKQVNDNSIDEQKKYIEEKINKKDNNNVKKENTSDNQNECEFITP